MSLAKSARELAKAIAFRYTKLGVPRYPYNLEPIQLAQLVMELERVRPLQGSFVEIGVARGLTTRFLCEHIRVQRPPHAIDYYALDTFSSFTDEDLNYEVEKRGKELPALRGFEYNDYAVWKRNFAEFPFLKAIQSDCSTFDYSRIAPIKLAFLDVDLYLPTQKTLPRIYDALIPGGAILVDDVLDNQVYDGACQAYMEFCLARGLQPKVVGNKCGIIYKT